MYQKTISKQITFKGKGLHTGIFTNVLIKPTLKSNSGIIFRYLYDEEYIEIKANIKNIFSTNRCTTLISNCKNVYRFNCPTVAILAQAP